MISVGIFNGYYPYSLEEQIKKIKSHGMSCVQLDLSFKDIDFGTITKEKCIRVRDAFRDANLPIVCISAYTNMTAPDPAIRKANIDRLKETIKHAQYLGTPYVISETGTYNTESDWVWDDKNASEEAYEELLSITREITQVAYDHGATFLVENYVNNIIGSVNQVLRLFNDVNSKSIGLLLDPTNYFTGSNIGDVDGELNRIFNALAGQIKIAHAKDCKLAVDTSEKHAHLDADAAESHTFRGAGAVELPAPGLGSLNYDLYVQLLHKHCPNIPLIIEHLDESDIPRAKAFVDSKLKVHGC
jgi:sugar phosphate isomerase/epimerase